MFDFGMFGRRRTAFWLWVVLPPVLVIAVAIARAAFARHLSETERKYTEAVRAIPEMESSLKALQFTADRLKTSASEDDLTTESFGHKLHSAAARSALTVNALSADKAGESGNALSIRANLRVEGSLISILSFLNTLQSNGARVTVDAARLRATRLEPALQYELDVVLRAYRFTI